jgi:hypothetical protein
MRSAPDGDASGSTLAMVLPSTLTSTFRAKPVGRKA